MLFRKDAFVKKNLNNQIEKIYYINETGCPDEEFCREIDVEEAKEYLKNSFDYVLIWKFNEVDGLIQQIDYDNCGVPGIFIPLSRLMDFNVLIT